MCKISDKIKFCTCSLDDIDITELDNYWILYRQNENKFSSIIDGLFCLTVNLKYDEINKNTILNRLKEHDAFDKQIQFIDQDCLVIYLNKQSSSEELTYCFQFNEGVWEVVDYNPFSLNESSDEFKFGTLENPIEEVE